MDKAIRKRASVKSTLTVFSKFVESLQEKDEVSSSNLRELDRRLNRSQNLIEAFNEVQTEIESLCEDVNEEFCEREDFENKFELVIGLATDILERHNYYSDKNSDANSVHSANSSKLCAGIKPSIVLPQIDLPKFNGAPEDWLEYRATFENLIHSNDSLNDLQKFHYLKASLGGIAAQLVKPTPFIAENYSIAWSALCDEYDNSKVLIHEHVRSLFQLSSIHRENAAELKTLVNQVSQHLTCLEMLGESRQNLGNLLLTYLIKTKLDTSTAQEWEKYDQKGSLSWEDMKEFLKERASLLRTTEVDCNTDSKGKFKDKKRMSKSFVGNTGDSLVATKSAFSCNYCKQGHSIYSCKAFSKLKAEDRVDFVRQSNLCKVCLLGGHTSRNCKHGPCRKCRKFHNSLLHEAFYTPKKVEHEVSASEEGESSESSQNLSANLTSLSVSGTQVLLSTASAAHVLLSTALVKIIVGGQTYTARALLDSGSQSSFVTEALCNRLQLEKLHIDHTVRGIGMGTINIKNRVNIKISSVYNKFELDVGCLVISKITDKLPRCTFKKSIIKIPEHLKLADPNFNVTGEVDILLGAQEFWKIVCVGQMSLGASMPFLQNTRLGWIIAGTFGIANQEESFSYLTVDAEESTNELVSKFWTLEEVKNDRVTSLGDQYCEKYFVDNFKRNSDGRIIVKIPFKEKLNELGQSRDIAIKRFYSLERRLQKNEGLRQNYIEFMRDYQALDHMTEIADDPENPEGYFIPHHAIIKQSSVTTKCRIVFDASCKTDSGLSLNDVQYIGPTLQNDLTDILLRFRTYKYVIAADVSKMYRQILIDASQRKYQKIFWRENPDSDLKCFQLNTVTYGMASSPYLAVRSLKQLSQETVEISPIVSKVIDEDFYMDDLLTGANSESSLLEIQRGVTNVLAKSCLDLRKWMCSDPELIRRFEINENLEASILNLGEGENNKTLGICWNAVKDTMQYSVRSKVDHCDVFSKRSILSSVCQIFDPLGLIGPVVITGKLIIQELWKLKISWDDAVPPEIKQRWITFERDLECLNNLRIPRRCLITNNTLIELHGFCDASERAYGACIYIRSFSASVGYSSNILCAKTRVAPLKLVSLPRLELCGAVLLANLAKRVCSALNINFDRKYYYTDSMVALAWIKGEPTRWKTFVANRVSEIQGLTSSCEWYHIASEDNPADVLSRSLPPSQLENHNLWWHGPKWLTQENSSWKVSSNIKIDLAVPEQRKLGNNQNVVLNLIDKFSSFLRLQRVLAYVLRFLNSCKMQNKRRVGVLSREELDDSLRLLIKTVQLECFEVEYNCLLKGKQIPTKSNILALNPFMHQDVLRVGGRLNNADKTFNAKHQIILPKGHKLTKLLLIYEHERLMHCGAQQLLYSIREKFWPLHARNTCKQVVRQCVTCFKVKPTEVAYLMGSLPEYRVNENLPFINVGVDYGGPFLVKTRTRSRTTPTKIYIALFICMTTKAVHLEPVTELSTDAFLSTLKRFIARRGKPINIYSDNGKNFVGAKNELNRMYEMIESNHEVISNELSKDRINWHFIPPRSPAFGGIWEAGIKSSKFHLKRVIGLRVVTFENFLTILTQIEGIMNSRPLSPLSLDPGDLSALTPAHFLIGRSLTALPEGELTAIPDNRLNQYQKLQSLIQHFWSRWSKEYLTELQTRAKWKRDHKVLLKPGVMVLVKNEDLVICRWQLGRVVAVYPGPDGVVRVAEVQTTRGTSRRAVNKLCVLPVPQT
nr:unnamed protein product [Callosobruchus analis]